MGDFLHKVKEEIEETIESMQPIGGPEASPELVRMAQAAGVDEPGDDSTSPAAEEEAREG